MRLKQGGNEPGQKNLFIAEASFLLLIVLGFFVSDGAGKGALLSAAIACVGLLNIYAKRSVRQKKHAEELNLFTQQLQRLHTLIHSFLLTQNRGQLVDGMLEYLKSAVPSSACAAYLCDGSSDPDTVEMKIERLAWYDAEEFPAPDSEKAFMSACSMTPLVEYTDTGLEARRVSPIVFQSRVVGAVDIYKPAGMTSQELKIFQLLMDYVSSFWVLYGLIAQREEEATVDPLTGIWNRRYMLRRFKEEADRIARYDGSACVVMGDMGNFKQINDLYGHAKGDEVLIKVAAVLKKCLRSSDSVGRYGGDEFLLLLPNISESYVELVLERIGSELELLRIKCNDGGPDDTFIDVSLDFGTAMFPGRAATLMDTINLADEDMFANKAARKKRFGIPATREAHEKNGQKGAGQV